MLSQRSLPSRSILKAPIDCGATVVAAGAAVAAVAVAVAAWNADALTVPPGCWYRDSRDSCVRSGGTSRLFVRVVEDDL